MFNHYQNVVGISIEPPFDTPQRRHGLAQLLRIAGFRPRFDSIAPPGIYYGNRAPWAQGAVISIPADDESLWAARPPALTMVENAAILHFGETPRSLWHGNRLAFDVARATYHFLSLESERAVAVRDRHGRVTSCDSVPGRLNDPPVDGYARVLKQRLIESGRFRATDARWPGGARFAVALTHDVDTPERAGRAIQAFLALLHEGMRLKRSAYWQFRALIRDDDVRRRFARPRTHRPEWDFEHWCALESLCGFRSAFYLAVVDRRTGHECDVTYDATLRRYRRLIRRLADGGWEVGLHAAYLTWLDQPSIEEQMARFHRLTGRSPAGLRHHYLKLDPASPLETLAAHASAGLLYDTTVGFNDAPGFRAGTALPFETPDVPGRAARSFVEIPMTLADMHLPPYDIEPARQRVLDHLKRVRRLGGCAVLNWHVGHWHSHHGWRESYIAAINWLRNCADAWVATPAEIAAWWLDRESGLSRATAWAG